MGLLGPKEGSQGGPPKGLYKQRRGAPKTLILATIHGTVHMNSAADATVLATLLMLGMNL